MVSQHFTKFKSLWEEIGSLHSPFDSILAFVLNVQTLSSFMVRRTLSVICLVTLKRSVSNSMVTPG